VRAKRAISLETFVALYAYVQGQEQLLYKQTEEPSCKKEKSKSVLNCGLLLATAFLARIFIN